MRGSERLIVVTGGPGAGKSALIAALSTAGFRTAEEAGRKVIRAQVATGGDALPWGDKLAFAEAMLAQDFNAYAQAERSSGVTFFDRGAPDALGYLALCGIAPTAELTERVRELSYAPRVFLAPFWPEIYVNDAERKQDAHEARRTTDAMRVVYASLGHEIVELPRSSVEHRIDFVLSACGLSRAAP